MDVTWGESKNKLELASDSGLDNTGGLQDKWTPVVTEARMHLAQDSEKLQETRWAVEML